MRLVLFPALVAVLVLVFAVGLNESYAETEYKYRDDGTLKETTEYYNDGVDRKLVTEYRKDGSVKIETHYWWSYWISDYHLLYSVEYRTDGTLMKYSYYQVTNDVSLKHNTTKFNKDGLPIWKKYFSPNDGDISTLIEYKYYKDGKLKKTIQNNDYRYITEYKYYKDGKLKKVIENNELLSTKMVTEYNKNWVCIQLPGRHIYHEPMCPADILPDYDWFTNHDQIGHLIDADILPDYDYGGSPVKSTWYDDSGYVWIDRKYWNNGISKEVTTVSGHRAGVPVLDTRILDESGNPLTGTGYTADGTIVSIHQWNPDGTWLITKYKHGTDVIDSITELINGKVQKTMYLLSNGEVYRWVDWSPKEFLIVYDGDNNVIRINHTSWYKIFKPHCPPDRVSDHDRDNKPVCLPEPVQECSTDGVTEQDESGRITKTTWRNTDCDLLEYEDRAYWPNDNISQIIKYDADDNMIQFTYHSENGNIYASHKYEDGEKITSTFYRTDGSIYRVIEYNDDGNIFKITQYREDGSTYEVDPDN